MLFTASTVISVNGDKDSFHITTKLRHVPAPQGLPEEGMKGEKRVPPCSGGEHVGNDSLCLEEASCASMPFLCLSGPGGTLPPLLLQFIRGQLPARATLTASATGHFLPLNLSPLPLLRPQIRGLTPVLDPPSGQVMPLSQPCAHFSGV